MVLEKISKPLIQTIINKEVVKNQFGFRPLSDCGLAKAMIYYNSKKFNYNKALLIDIQKAYDSVNLDILITIIESTYNNKVIKDLLTNFIEIYKGLVLIINGTEINATRGLPQGSALSPLFFNLYINNVLKQINANNNVHGQAYADDIILQGNSIINIQTAYELAKNEFNKIELKINPEKCELISEQINDYIIDIGNNGSETKITSVKQAKYLGQIINADGSPVNSDINLNYLNGLLTKFGTLSKTAKIRIFQTYVRSKINHLLPMLALAGNFEEVWKKLRKFIFNNLIEFNTLPRESASAFGLGYYEIIIRPIKKLIERNQSFSGNEEETKMLNESLISALKQWLIAEPNHTRKVKEIILDNIEKNKTSNLKEFDTILTNEYTERLYRNHIIQNEIAQKLKKVKSPSLIILLSNEPEHEIKQKINKLLNEEDQEKINDIKMKIVQKVNKIKSAIEFIKENKIAAPTNDITDCINNENIQLTNLIIKEIKINKMWKKIIDDWKPYSELFITNIINNKQKIEDIDTSEINKLVEKLREEVAKTNKETCSQLEIALELYEQEEFHKKIVKKNDSKKRPGRPKAKKLNDKSQTKIDNFFKQ